MRETREPPREAPIEMRDALIVIQTQVNAQEEAMGRAFVKIKGRFDVREISSIYLKYLEQQRHQNSQGTLSCAVRVGTELLPFELNSTLRYLEADLGTGVQFHLVMYEEEAILTADLTLPHPELHLNLDWLVPCAEIWRHWSHPVLKRSLPDVAAETSNVNWGEFHAQGKVLLDFHFKHKK